MNVYKRILIKASSVFASIRRLLFNLFIPNVTIWKHTVIEPHIILRSQYGGIIMIGNNCYVSSGAPLLTHGGDIVIGDNCTINPYSILYGQGVKNGDGVRIAANCTIVP